MKLHKSGVGKIFYKLQTVAYRLTGGALGGVTSGVPTLLLTTTGRKSGRARTTPLLYLEDGSDYVVVASSAAQPTHPAWWLNLEKNPDATIQIGSEKKAVRAAQADGNEKKRLWPRLTEIYEGFQVYQDNVKRDIPVVILTPV
ncbi:MAG: nitroreductase family deazaflavin-dependent oxidoreductase [Deltaproteobacteria bacterium]|nr:nitroreductase family deazaflavin-dependent oxidoreductase [Deltaproteobacteria bacterium]